MAAIDLITGKLSRSDIRPSIAVVRSARVHGKLVINDRTLLS
jgi:hypothetical protein